MTNHRKLGIVAGNAYNGHPSETKSVSLRDGSFTGSLLEGFPATDE